MKPRIKIALGSYDRHGPLLERAIHHRFFDFEFLEVDPHQGRHALYSYEQGLSRRQWTPEELFVPIDAER